MTGRRGTSLLRRQIELLETAEGFFGAQVLFTANELGVFAELAEGPRSAADLSRALRTDRDAIERVLNACVALKLLTRVDGRYANTEVAHDILVPGKPGYLGNWLRLLSRWMKVWVNLTDTVRTGQPAEDPWISLGGDPDYTRDFILGMHDYAHLRGREIIRYVDLQGGLRVVDVGGGPGSYAVLFATEWPDLQVTVFDLPGVVPLAQKHAEESGVSDRVSVQPGNYYEDEFGTDYDVVFLSDTLHQEDPEVCEMILQKAYRSLRPGGRVVVQAMFLNEDRISPRWPAIYSLILLLIYGGRAYTVAETVDLIERAGFVDCAFQRMSLLNVNSLLTARKP
ncbi:MAG TPA: methyltransferase [Gaiellaceae bacterium]|jgi:SAM-dependent methyltransferase